MTVDDLTAPLGREPKKRRRSINIPVPQVIVGVLSLFLGIFVLWAVSPTIRSAASRWPLCRPISRSRPIHRQSTTHPPATLDTAQQQPPAAPAATAVPSAPPANTTTVTIIDGKTGAKQEVVVPGPATPAAAAAAPAAALPIDQKFVEMTGHGPIPKSPPTARGRPMHSRGRSSHFLESPTRPASRSSLAASA